MLLWKKYYYKASFIVSKPEIVKNIDGIKTKNFLIPNKELNVILLAVNKHIWFKLSTIVLKSSL